MSVDYFLINFSKNEYIWLGKWDPVEGHQLTKETLEEGFSKNYIRELLYNGLLDSQLKPTDGLYIFSFLLNYYKTLNEYIENGDRCEIIADTDSAMELLDSSLFVNDEITEDKLTCERYNYLDICEVMA